MQIIQLSIKKSYVSGYHVQKKVKKPVRNAWASWGFGLFEETYNEEWVYVDELLNESKDPIRFETIEEAEQFISKTTVIPKRPSPRIIKEGAGSIIMPILTFIAYHVFLIYFFWLLFFN